MSILSKNINFSYRTKTAKQSQSIQNVSSRRLQSSVMEKQRLERAKAVANEDQKSHLQNRSDLVSRRIGILQQKLKKI